MRRSTYNEPSSEEHINGLPSLSLTNRQWYSAGHTEDLRSALLYISAKYPEAPLIGIGFSLGANILTRYLGEEGPQSRLRGGLVLACVRLLLYVSEGLPLMSLFLSRHSLGIRRRTVIGLCLGSIVAEPAKTNTFDRLQYEFIPKHVYSKALGGNQLAMFKSHRTSVS